jgi:predicted transcriptional regulator of viral defense system
MIRFATGAVVKRLGYLVETLDLPSPERAERLAGWQTYLTAGIALFDPGESAGGSACVRWRVRDHISLAPAEGVSR